MRIEGMAPMLLVAVLGLTALCASAGAEDGYAVVPGTLINSIGKWVGNTGVAKADATTSYGPARLISVGMKQVAAGATPTDAMARIAYLAVDPKTQDPKSETEFEFQINFTWTEGQWVYTGGSQVTQVEGKETLAAVTYFNPPPPPPKLGVLVGEEGKPVQTTKSGMKYVVLEEGTGAKPKKGQTIAAEYTGWLMDGTQFDTSKGRDEAFEFAVGEENVIPGWDEALLDMKVGERRKLTIPPALAYGAQGTPGGPIPPNATLIFEVKLTAIK